MKTHTQHTQEPNNKYKIYHFKTLMISSHCTYKVSTAPSVVNERQQLGFTEQQCLGSYPQSLDDDLLKVTMFQISFIKFWL